MGCYCGKAESYENCCEPIIHNVKQAKTAEDLMRARYSAFVKSEIDFIVESNHPQTRDDIDVEANREWSRQSKWLGLEIVKTLRGKENDTEGEVEFIAHFEIEGKAHQHHELATFEKHKGQWYFLEGRDLSVQTYIRTEEKIGRNDPCPCGSGKKYKKCCEGK